MVVSVKKTKFKIKGNLMSLTLEEIKNKYQVFATSELNEKEKDKYIETIFKNNDLMLLDKMKRVSWYEPSLLEAFKKGTIYSSLISTYYEIFEPALKLAQEHNIQFDHKKLFTSLLQNKDKRCIYTYFETFAQNEMNSFDFKDNQKYTFEYLVAFIETQQFSFLIDLFQQNEQFFKFYEENFISLAFRKMDDTNMGKILPKIQVFIEKGLAQESTDHLSLLLLNWVDNYVDSTISTQKRDFYDNVYREGEKSFVAHVDEVFTTQQMKYIKEIFSYYLDKGYLNEAFVEKYQEDKDYFEEVGINYSYWQQNGEYKEVDFVMQCEKALLEKKILSPQEQTKKIKL